MATNNNFTTSGNRSANTPSTSRRKAHLNTTTVTTNSYVDEDGYNVIEYKSPSTSLVLKYNDTHMIYSYNSEIRYDGPIDTSFFDAGLASFDKDLFDFNKSYEEMQRELDEWDKKFDKWMNEMPSYPTLGYTTSNQYHSTIQTPRPHYNRRYRQRTYTGGCGSCLFVTVIIFVVACLVLYGMGVLGGNIIDFIRGLF